SSIGARSSSRCPRREAAGAAVARYDSSVLRQRLTDRLSRVPGLVAAYLFGSRARGDSTASSDADVAIWLENKPTTFHEHLFALAGELERNVGVPVDVVVLNDAPSDLVHRVLRDGVLLVEHDRGARIRFEVRARNDYFDMMPIRDRYRRAGARKGA